MHIVSTWQAFDGYPVEMAEYSGPASVGARVAAARRARGYRSAAELGVVLEGTGITPAVLANIESGRKSDLDVSQVLNLAKILELPVSFLLAPLARPNDPVDLPNLIPELAAMTASEFDAWLCSIPNAEYTATKAHERSDRAELQALRELRVLERELRRLKIVNDLETSVGRPVELEEAMKRRVSSTEYELEQLRNFLKSSGLEI